MQAGYFNAAWHDIKNSPGWFGKLLVLGLVSLVPVSYTHLDVYKRQELGGEAHALGHGALAIAAVTSCTTATDPRMMLACGLVAKKAAEAGLAPKPWVKTVLAPGSKATELLLERAGLMEGLRALGFYTCGFGCMSCIGNSGPILPALHDVASDIELASVLSGCLLYTSRCV